MARTLSLQSPRADSRAARVALLQTERGATSLLWSPVSPQGLLGSDASAHVRWAREQIEP